MEISELKISVPWGHVADICSASLVPAKIWGNSNDPLVIAIHGLMDNAGSFDRLIPLLPKPFCYVCIDLPGHGKSTHFPPSVPIYHLNFVVTLKLILQHFKQEKYTILAHSFGGHVTFFFTLLYPKYVEKIIFLDILHIAPTSSDQFKTYLRGNIDYAITLAEKMRNYKTRPSYIYTEALERVKNRRFPTMVLTEDAAKAILKRSVIPLEDGRYRFAIDARLKGVIGIIGDFDYILEVIKKSPILCPVLSIVAEGAKTEQEYREPLMTFLKKYKNFSFVSVEGNHDVHNNNPEIVAPYVAEFLLKYKGKL